MIMMSGSDAPSVPPDVCSLQEKVRSLEHALEEQKEEFFDLSATLATVQAETQHEIKQIQQQRDTEIQKVQEALRRTEREATRLHHQLSRTSTGPTAPTSAPVVTPAATTNNNAADAASSQHRDTDSSSSSATTRRSLAQHLLQTCPRQPPSLVIMAASNSFSTSDLAFVWQLAELCLRLDDEWIWLKHALTWSTAARRIIQQAASEAPISRSTRISSSSLTSFQLQQVTQSLYDPLGSSNKTHEANNDYPYLRDLTTRLLAKLSAPKHFSIMSVLLSDASPKQRDSLGWQPLCASQSSRIPATILACAVTWLDETTQIRTARSIFEKAGTDLIDTSPEALSSALQIMCQCWSSPRDQPSEWGRIMMGCLLDLLEFHVLTQADVQLGLDILRVLKQWSATSLDGVVLLRTQFGISNGWTSSGIGVVLQLWNRVMTTTCFNDDNLSQSLVLASECVRLLNLILQHLQHQRQRAEASKQFQGLCSFSSVLQEYCELHRSSCHLTLASNERFSPDIRQLVRLQLEEIDMDEEEMEEMRQALALAAGGNE